MVISSCMSLKESVLLKFSTETQDDHSMGRTNLQLQRGSRGLARSLAQAALPPSTGSRASFTSPAGIWRLSVQELEYNRTLLHCQAPLLPVDDKAQVHHCSYFLTVKLAISSILAHVGYTRKLSVWMFKLIIHPKQRD